MGLNVTLTEVGIKSCALKLAYLKSIQAILKIIEMIIAIAIITTVACYFNNGDKRVTGDLFFLLIIVTFFICTVCLFISEWIVWSAVESCSKSMFEIVFFVVSVILLFSSSVNLFSNSIAYYESDNIYIAYVIISALQLVLIGLYTTDIVICFCLNCCGKKARKEDLN